MSKELTDEQKKEANKKILSMAMGEAFKPKKEPAEDGDAPMVPGHSLLFVFPDSRE